jgi:putative transcriptional regulator
MSKVGDDLVEAFAEMAAHLRGEIDVFSCEAPDGLLTPEKIKATRQKVARSTRAFEADFQIPARTMEAYEQGRRKPDAAMTALLRIIEKEPEAAQRALETGAKFHENWPAHCACPQFAA